MHYVVCVIMCLINICDGKWSHACSSVSEFVAECRGDCRCVRPKMYSASTADLSVIVRD